MDGLISFLRSHPAARRGLSILSVVLLTIGLWNSGLTKSEKGFYAMSFVLSMFAAIAVQKNTRDMKASEVKEE